AILMIIASLGFGGGFGSGNSNGDGGNSKISSENSVADSSDNDNISETDEITTETLPEETTETIRYMEITVSGDTYFMNDNEKTLDAFISLASDSENIVVKITDDNAVADAMESLISALKNNNIQYIEPTE
ncbi:MAG: hypothetical protein K2G14_06065, partial [Ruminococcus sp.]|nr:hypothetical protein [Ruminococcus sp.]